ncbi:hypothetical protein C6P44_001931 [Monosporozyma unispora]|nr:hypothetical protein C6P44_001931 [Kazachstania unispora]
MQFTTLLSAAIISSVALANEVVTSNGQTITYVDVTTTPEVTKSVVSTVLSTSTPHVTTTISGKVSSSKKDIVTSTDLQVAQQTKTVTSCSSTSNLPQVDAFSAAGNNLNVKNGGMFGMIIAGIALL